MTGTPCTKCGYLLDGLPEVSACVVVCPECSLPQVQRGAKRRKPVPYFVPVLVAIVWHGLWFIWALIAMATAAPVRAVGPGTIAAIGTPIAALAGHIVARRRGVASAGAAAKLFIVGAAANFLIVAALFVLALFAAASILSR